MSTSIAIPRLPAPFVAALVLLTLPAYAAGKMPGTLYVHTGHLGSTIAVSGSAASVNARLAWRPYGTPRVTSSGPDAAEPARFTGKQWAKSTGLSYFGARYHDAAAGRFLSPDAARQASSPYAYVGAAPLERVDPDGNTYTPETIEQIIRVIADRHKLKLESKYAWGKATDLAIRRARQYGEHAHTQLHALEHEISELKPMSFNRQAMGLKEAIIDLDNIYQLLEGDLNELEVYSRRHEPTEEQVLGWVELLDERGRAGPETVKGSPRAATITPPGWRNMLTDLRNATGQDARLEIVSRMKYRLSQYRASPAMVLPKVSRRLPSRAPEQPTSYAVANRLQHRILERVRSESMVGNPYTPVIGQIRGLERRHAEFARNYRRNKEVLDGLYRYKATLEGRDM